MERAPHRSAWVAALTALAVFALAACTGPVRRAAPDALLHDERFRAPTPAIDPDEAFALSSEMRHYLALDLRPAPGFAPLPGELVAALGRKPGLKLDYDSTATRNAAQTFAARRGNCLSLVLMAAALAKAMDLEVSYQAVEVEETWSLNGNVAYLNGHVNLILAQRAVDVVHGSRPARAVVVDFFPPDEIRRERTRPLTEDELLAMYMNNRAAEELAAGRIDNAYGWARAAITRAPAFAVAYNTLGVIYHRHGDLDAARAVFQVLLDRKETERLALANQAIVLQELGDTAQAAALRTRLATLEDAPPFHYYLLGQQAMQAGDYATARRLFAREVERAGYNGHFRYWLGLANLRLGEVAEARRQIELALDVSTDAADRGLYAAKLERLRAAGVP